MTADTENKLVEVPIDLSDDEWLVLFRMAHEQDITLNQLVDKILRTALGMD